MCCCFVDAAHTLRAIVRMSLGLSLIFLGITHFRDAEFAVQVSAGLGVLTSMGYVWGVVLPALYVVGGILLLLGIGCSLATAVSGLALASVPVGLLLKSALGTLPLDASMPAVLNAFIWLLLLRYACGGCGPVSSHVSSGVSVDASVSSAPTAVAAAAPKRSAAAGKKKVSVPKSASKKSSSAPTPPVITTETNTLDM